MPFRLLDGFRQIFEGQAYRHRSSTHGDRLARLVYEDLYTLGRSALLKRRIDDIDCVVNVTNRVTGIKVRRGDGTFGESLPTVPGVKEPGFVVGIGPTANVQIGIEVKILATAMIKQIDRVITSLRDQAIQFKSRNPSAITMAIIGVNHATRYSSYEGDRIFVAEGGRSPAAEAPKAIQRLDAAVRKDYDEFIVLPFQATNSAPFPFDWMDFVSTENLYSAALIRTLRLYETRFQ
jgi:hypothetical protein